MAKLTALGTGCAYATGCYNESFLLETGTGKIVFDTGGGNGIMKQLERAGIAFPFDSVDAVVVSHHHIDHAMGLPWLVSCRALAARNGEAVAPLDVYAPKKAVEFIEAILEYEPLIDGDAEKYVLLHEAVDGDRFEIAGMEVEFVESSDVASGQLAALVELDDGTKVAYCGDATVSPEKASVLSSIDVLVHDAFCLEEEAEKFKIAGSGHSTVEEACAVAESVKARKLVLAHMYDNLRSARKSVYGYAGEQIYSGDLIVPDDMEVIEI